eukprot:TRINITY_DN7851_c0_g1_i1.p1 TRINITY_DN7851_c0_g1~~TRINITY_DN7851_c0_g1_i1.p1  ORF type:complete len:432 (-),score=119.79 TRINITY_DN7851_c0_g1_i1:38-1333(-)
MSCGGEGRFFPLPSKFLNLGDEIRSEFFKSTLPKLPILLKTFKGVKDESKYSKDLYLGTSGMAFAFWRVSQSILLEEKQKTEKQTSSSQKQVSLSSLISYDEAISLAQKFLPSKSNLGSDPELDVSLLCGSAGILLTSALISSSEKKSEDTNNILKEYLSLQSYCLNSKHPEILYGKAGYLFGIQMLEKIPETKQLLDPSIKKLIDSLIQQGRDTSKKLFPSSSHLLPLMWAWYGESYIGAAHGLMGILYVLLHFEYCCSEPTIRKDIIKSIDWLLSIKQANGNWPVVLDETEPSPQVHWCHGAPGAVFLFAKAAEVFKEKKYFHAAVGAAEFVYKFGLLKKGPGLCHGIAGNGYVFVYMYQKTKEAKWLSMAYSYANFIFSDVGQTLWSVPDHPLSLFEGLAGTLCFIVDLIHPQHSAFPFFQVDGMSST